ncbi:MAG: Gfo/Idh/MocA family oxidoreductase [Rhodospirillaceae bacterium]|nr:Gfo/Idh/MocA family oxidoreductase [Rhodospirillaceae bacterium]MBT5897450.1 Gfo/Idh/MocA family oxidoreductase [Rhodospirillaceae bacterium]MBT6427494.1 Gfo/Idh/MocA family oxidoreductase [Rhodospirillaceae bacterium]
MHRVGVIGLGIMGRRMITNLVQHGGFSDPCAWDPEPRACADAAVETPGLTIMDGADAVIAAADLVYIATPPLWHRNYAERAMAAGKPVYSEKPLGINVAESRALVTALEESGTPNVVNFIQAASRAVTLTEERIVDGSLGDITGADIIVHFARWPRDWQADADWLRFRDQGGYSREVLSHFLYVIQRLLGPATLVSATPVYPADPALCETHISATLDCNGVPVSVLGSSGGAGPDRVEMIIWGSHRSHRLHDWFLLQSSDGGEWQQEFPEVEDPRAQAFGFQLDNVAAWVEGRENILPSARDALMVQELVEAMLTGK